MARDAPREKQGVVSHVGDFSDVPHPDEAKAGHLVLLEGPYPYRAVQTRHQ